MTLFAAFGKVRTPSQVGIRVWDDGWTDITRNLNSFIPTGTPSPMYCYISDIRQVNGNLFCLFNNQGIGQVSRVLVYQGGQWVLTHASPEGSYSVYEDYDAFFDYNGQVYVNGFSLNSTGYYVFTIWKLEPSSGRLIPFAKDEHRDMGTFFTQAWPRCVIQSPSVADTIIVGDAFDDRFAYVNMRTKVFHHGSHPGGSCIFSFGVDKQGALWSGNYADYFYYSTDGGISFSDALVGNRDYPEVWEMVHWQGQLYGVGCEPSGIVRRRPQQASMTLSLDWEVVHQDPVNLSVGPGVGFQSAVPESRFGGRLFIGYGGEPYYYLRQPVGKPATVFAWDGHTLTDIGAALNWLDGVHRLVGPGVNNLTSSSTLKNVNFW